MPDFSSPLTLPTGTARRRRACPIWAVLSVVALVASGAYFLVSQDGGWPSGHLPTTGASPPLASVVQGQISVNFSGGRLQLPGPFWGANVRVYDELGSAQAGWWKATPLGYARWPGGAVADGYNFTSNLITYPTGATYHPPQDERMFVNWCRTTHCQAIFGVPGEIDDPSTAAFYVNYTEHSLGFHPAYWEIGNEPALWQKFGLPWSKWHNSSGQPVGPVVYSEVVQHYIRAMRAIDPTIRIVGLPGTGVGSWQDTTWLRDTVRLNGPNLSAVAIHVYSAGTGPSSNATLSEFFATLSGKGSLGARVPADRSAIAAACPQCGPIPLFVTELGSGIAGGAYDPFMSTYPQVPYIAASLVQGMKLNVTNIDLFAFQGGYDGSLFTGEGVALPLYSLYSRILPQLGSTIVASQAHFAVAGVYVVATLNRTNGAPTMLVVNTNSSSAVQFDLSASGFPMTGPATTWVWDSGGSSPTRSNLSGGLPAVWVVPPDSLLLLSSVFRTSSAPPSYAVQFQETGLPTPPTWSVAVNGRSSHSGSATLELNLTNGTYSYTVGNVSGFTATPPAGSFTVAGRPLTVGIAFVRTSSAPIPPSPDPPASAPPPGPKDLFIPLITVLSLVLGAVGVAAVLVRITPRKQASRPARGSRSVAVGHRDDTARSTRTGAYPARDAWASSSAPGRGTDGPPPVRW